MNDKKYWSTIQFLSSWFNKALTDIGSLSLNEDMTPILLTSQFSQRIQILCPLKLSKAQEQRY